MNGRTLDDIKLDAILNAIDRIGTKAGAARELGITNMSINRYIRAGFSDGSKFEIIQDGHRHYKVIRHAVEGAA